MQISEIKGASIALCNNAKQLKNMIVPKNLSNEQQDLFMKLKTIDAIDVNVPINNVKFLAVGRLKFVLETDGTGQITKQAQIFGVTTTTQIPTAVSQTIVKAPIKQAIPELGRFEWSVNEALFYVE